jgi:hypothetical protein
MTRTVLERRIRLWLLFFVVALTLSGLTAFPLEREMRWLYDIVASRRLPFVDHWPALVGWARLVRDGIADSYARYPFAAYATDWLAFAHLVIATVFWGPLRDPVRNRWVIDWAMLACVGVLPLALICGQLRGIPWFWRAVDMSFGVFGIVPLVVVRRDIQSLARMGGPVG